MTIIDKIKDLLRMLAENIHKRRRVVLALSCVVVFVTTYMLILPAFTLEKTKAAEQGGIDVPGVTTTAEDVSEEDADADDGQTDAQDAPSESGKTEDGKVEDSGSKSKDSGEDKADSAQTADPLTFEDEHYTIAVDDKNSVLPENTEIKVEEIDKNEDAKKYQKHFDDALAAIQEEKDGENVSDLEFARFYDISLVSDGKEVTLGNGDKVSVNIEYDKELRKALGVENKDNIRIIHFAENKDTGKVEAEVLDNKEAKVTAETTEDNLLKEAAFDAESFSVYGLVYVKEAEEEAEKAEEKTEETAANSEIDLGTAVVSTVDGSDLPEDVDGHADVVAGKKAIAAVEKKVDDIDADKTEYKVFDIALENIDESEYKDGFKVDVTLPEEIKGKDFRLFHIHDGKVEELDVQTNGSKTVDGFTFETENFSQFVLSYTVDFEYNGYTYSIPGESKIKLSELFDKLGIKESVKDVTDARFSNPNLVKVTHRQGVLGWGEDWILESIEPFSSEETLTILMADGTSFVINVTDAQFGAEDYITDAQLTIDGTTYGKNDTWNVYPDVDYSISFWLGERGSIQFPKGGETITIPMPEGLTLKEGESGTFDIPAGLAGTITGNTYKVVNGQLVITFGPDPDDILTRSSTARFEVHLSARFTEHSGEMNFNDNVKPDVNTNTDTDVSVSKSGSYNAETGQMDYAITVKSTGKSKNVSVHDVISGSALTMDQEKGVTIEPDKTLSQPVTMTDHGFDLTIGEMAHNETVTIRYSADIDYSYVGDDFKIIDSSVNGKNAVDVENDDHKTDHTDFVFNNEIKFSDTSKTNISLEDGTNNATLEWKIVANSNMRASIVGGRITDSIDWNSKDAMTYQKDENGKVVLNITAKNPDGSIAKTWSEPVSVQGGNSAPERWTYTIPVINDENEKLSYEITYKTVVDKTKLPSSSAGFVKNNVDNNHGGSTSGSGYVPGTGGEDDDITAGKTAATVTEDYIDWDIVVVVPAEGFDTLTVVDDLPATNTGKGYRDTLEGEPTVEGLIDGESFDWDLSYSNDQSIRRDGETLLREIVNMSFSYVDEGGQVHSGLKGTGSPRTITIRIRSKNDPLWVEDGTTNSYFSNHTNRAKVNRHNVRATAQPVKGQITKTGKKPQEMTLGNGQKVIAIPYDIMLSGVTEEPVVLDDYFDTNNLALLDPSSNKDAYYIYWGNETYSNNNSDRNIPTFSIDNNDGHLHIVADNLKKQEDGSYYPYYHIRYVLYVKPEKTNQVIQEAINNKGTKQFSNSVKWGDIGDTAKVDYTVPVVSKEGFFHDSAVTGFNNRMYDFAIDINPNEYRVNDGNPMDLSDTHTANLSVQYNTIKAYRVKSSLVNATLYKNVLQYEAEKKQGPIEEWKQQQINLFYAGVEEAPEVEWNFDGNMGSFTGIKDETHYLIVYSALVIGSDTQKFSNEADMEGFIATKQDERYFDSSASGAAEVYQIGLLKHMQGKTSEGLQGAVFQLFRGTGTYHEVSDGTNTWMEEDRVPMTWGEGDKTAGKVGQNITFTTGEDGYVLIALNQSDHGAELEEGVHYYLKEIDSPPGYQIDSSVEYWEFTLTMDPDEVCYGTERDEYGNRKWIYFYYDDILRMTNTPTTEPLKVEVDKTWLGFDGQPLDMTAEENRNLTATVQLYQKVDDGEYQAVTGTISSQDGTKQFDGTVVLNSSNEWKYSWEDLPRDDGTHKYAYRLEETDYPQEFASVVDEHETETVKTYNITNQKVQEKNISVSVSKLWKQKDGTTTKTDNLPESIKFYIYRVVSRQPFTIPPTSGGNRYEIEGDDHLVNDSETGTKVYQINSSEYGGVSFKNLPSVEHKEDGWYFYSYYVKELPMEGYSSSVTIDSSTDEETNQTILLEALTNTELPAPVDLNVTKVWQDDTGDEIEAPNGVTVKFLLYQVSSSKPFDNDPTTGGSLYTVENHEDAYWEGGKQIAGTYVLDKYTHGWDSAFTGLPQSYIDDKGRVTYYAYYVEEVAVPGYDSSANLVRADSGDYTFTLTNKVHPETTNLTVDKTWLNKDGELPLLVDRSNQETTYRIYRVEGTISAGKAIINDDFDNQIDASDVKNIPVVWGNETSRFYARNGDNVTITVKHTDGNTINPTLKYAPPNYNNSIAADSTSTDEEKVFKFQITDEMTGFRIDDNSGGKYTVTIENESTQSVQFHLTQDELNSLDSKEPYGGTLTIVGNGTATSDDLPVVSKGKYYTYFLVEEGGEEYSAEYTISGDTIHVTNKEPDMLEVNKTWLDSDGNDITANKSDGTITYDLYQVNVPAAWSDEYSHGGNISLDISNFNNDGQWDHVHPVLVGEASDGRIKAGSTIQITISSDNKYDSNKSLEGTVSVTNGNVDSDVITETDNGKARTIIISNVENGLRLNGTIKTNAQFPLEIEVLREPSEGIAPTDEAVLTSVKMGEITVGKESASVEFESDFAEYGIGVYAGPTPWSSVIDNLPKTGENNSTYTYYVTEHAVDGFELVEITPNPSKSGTQIIIKNKEKETPKGSLSITKAVTEGLNASGKVFTFAVTLTNADGTPYVGPVKVKDKDSILFFDREVTTDDNGVITVQVNGKGTATISDIPTGTTYVVTEPSNTLPTGWSQTGNVDYGDADKVISANDEDTATITNTYTATGTVPFTAKKHFIGGTLAAGDYSFTLVEYTDGTFSTIKTDGVNQTKTNDASGNVAFDNVALTESGSRYFIIKESAGSDSSIAYDDFEQKVTVTSTDDKEGHLVPVKSYESAVGSEGYDAEFTNSKLKDFEFTKEWRNTEGQKDDSLWTTGTSITVDVYKYLDSNKSKKEKLETYTIEKTSNGFDISPQNADYRLKQKSGYTFELTGLEAYGTISGEEGAISYYAVETAAVSGYKDPAYENISPVDGETYTSGGTEALNSGKIINTPEDAVELPHTGGIGTTIFYILGSILVIGGGIYFISRRRAMK